MVAEGIVDQGKIARSPVSDAASAAGMMLTTETLVTDLPEQET